MTRPRHPLCCAALALLLALTAFGGDAGSEWRAKVDPWVLDTVESSGEAEVLIVLDEQADLRQATSLHGKRARGRFVVGRLQETARRSQGPVLDALRERGVEHRAFWVANVIWARADHKALEELARRPEVMRVLANPEVRLDPGAGPDPAAAVDGVRAVEPSIAHVGAPDLWAAGFRGQDVVVAGQDTGYDWDHPALIEQYRGWDGDTAVHDYSWHDAIHSGGGVCGPDSTEPCDDHGHGTHTMGTMVGDDGADHQIGVAPGARWIGCRNMDEGAGTPATYIECFEFFIAPTDLADENPRPDLAPDVVNNSWACDASEGCTDPGILQTVVESTRAAGILVVASAGNAGPGCWTVANPPAIYDASLTVGSTDNSDYISFLSSRGPVTVDGSDRLKPDLVAPGESIISASPGGGYVSKSGTSMSGPHVAGVAALVISAAPCLAGDVDAIEEHLRLTAVPRTTTVMCGDVPGSEIPNNTYGHGAVRAVAPDPSTCLIFADGFESGDLGAWNGPVSRGE